MPHAPPHRNSLPTPHSPFPNSQSPRRPLRTPHRLRRVRAPPPPPRRRFTSPEALERVQNLYFAYLFVLRAVLKAGPILSELSYDTGLPQEDARTKRLVQALVGGCRGGGGAGGGGGEVWAGAGARWVGPVVGSWHAGGRVGCILVRSPLCSVRGTFMRECVAGSSGAGTHMR
jgi:hypothetical protein